MNSLLEPGAAIYVALAVALSVWIGIFFYLWRIDAQARELRRRLDNQPDQEALAQPVATLRKVEDRDQRNDPVPSNVEESREPHADTSERELISR